MSVFVYILYIIYLYIFVYMVFVYIVKKFNYVTKFSKYFNSQSLDSCWPLLSSMLLCKTNL